MIFQRYFKNLTGYNLTAFSFPYGSYESCLGCKKILKESGFKKIERVKSFSLFKDTSEHAPFGAPISLNLIAYK